jgi:hypothetical protein
MITANRGFAITGLVVGACYPEAVQPMKPAYWWQARCGCGWKSLFLRRTRAEAWAEACAHAGPTMGIS